jgi:prepilin-type N-terminal cleavage/methylation domain-containing protein
MPTSAAGSKRPLALPQGFTLLELLVVVALIAVATAGVSLSLRDSAQSALQRDAERLAVLLETLANNYDHIRRLFDGNAMMLAFNWLSHKLKRNSRTGSKKNIHAHYDLGNDFYRVFLDESLAYSCAFFEHADQDLAAAQRAKSLLANY